MSLVTFKLIKGTENILAEPISQLKSMSVYEVLDPEGEG